MRNYNIINILYITSILSLLVGIGYISYGYMYPSSTMSFIGTQVSNVTIPLTVKGVESPYNLLYSVYSPDGKVILQNEVDNVGSEVPVQLTLNIGHGTYKVVYTATKLVNGYLEPVYSHTIVINR